MNCYYAHNEQKKNKKELQVIIFKPKKKKKEDDFFNKEGNLSKINKSSEMIESEFNSDIHIKRPIIFSNKNEFNKDLNGISTKNSKTLNNFEIIKKDLENNVQKVDVNNQKISKNYLDKNIVNSNNNIAKFKNINNPINIELIKELTKDSYTDYTLDNTFLVFISVDNIFYLIYTNIKRSIISFNLSDNKKINEIKKAHNRDITNFRHFLDKINKRDLIISISLSDNNLKLWNISNYDCLLNIKNVNKTGRLFSACLFSYLNNNYILTSSAYGNNLESIKVFDFNGNKIKEINDSKDSVYFIDVYKENESSDLYILTGNNGYTKSYNYLNNSTYHKYSDNDNNRHCSIVINNNNGTVKMIESGFDGHLRIWDFHGGILLKKIKICDNDWLFGICLWNDDCLFVGCGDKTIKLVDLKSGLIINHLSGNKNKVLTIKALDHSKYGKCLISQGYEKDQIKLLINKICI